MFVGSSKEGLNVANAVQANLWRVAEITVWTQGVFKPSSVTLPAILDSLETQDFGLFVFTPDDIALIRGQNYNVVRDNVIFELGIFIGRLGLNRSFFLIPDDAEMRIATDLLGITPLRYETKRSDDNLTAAVGPSCTEVETEIRRLGFGKRLADSTTGAPSGQESNSSTIEQTRLNETAAAAAEIAPPPTVVAPIAVPPVETWIDAFIAADYVTMRDRLSQRLSESLDVAERRQLEAWHAHAEFRLDPIRGKSAIIEIEQKHRQSTDAYEIGALAYLWEGAPQDALDLSNRGLAIVEGNKTQILINKARALTALEQEDEAIESLKLAAMELPPVPGPYLLLADLFLARKDYAQAQAWLDEGVRRVPKSSELLVKHANVLSDHFDKKAALLQFNTALAVNPGDARARTLRGNLYLEMELNSLAMDDYLLANKLADGKAAWIIANIGNLYKNVGLYGLAIPHFKQALDLNWTSSFAHERLAGALRLQDGQIAHLREMEGEGRKALEKLRRPAQDLSHETTSHETTSHEITSHEPPKSDS
jgi:tetratricopeptide (TPR) repeat protein